MSTRESRARHRAEPASFVTIRGLLASASAIAGASLVAVVAAGGTYALWDGAAGISPTTVHSGSTGLTVNNVASYPLSGTAWSKLLPGDVVSQQVTVKNTGNVPGTVSALTTGSFTPLLVHVAKAACTGTPITGTSSTTTPTNLGVFAAGEAATVCLQVTMPAGAADTVQGTSQSFTVTFTSTTGS